MLLGRALIIVWLVWCAVQTKKYSQVWKSDLALWAYAAERSPLLPRPVINYGKALIADGQRERGLAIASKGYELERQRQEAFRAGLRWAR